MSETQVFLHDHATLRVLLSPSPSPQTLLEFIQNSGKLGPAHSHALTLRDPQIGKAKARTLEPGSPALPAGHTHCPVPGHSLHCARTAHEATRDEVTFGGTRPKNGFYRSVSTQASSAVASENLLHCCFLGQCSRKKTHFNSKFWK